MTKKQQPVQELQPVQEPDSSLLEGELGTTSELTREHILNRLMEDEGKKFHTEIQSPHAMSTFDAADNLIRDEFGTDLADFLDGWRDWFRTNMVPYQRKRAKEMIEGIRAESAKEEAKLKNRILGELGR